MSNIIEMYLGGGFFMHFILTIGVFVAAFSVERGIALYLKHKDAPADLRKNFLISSPVGT